MSDRSTLRNRHGQLTADALKSGLVEQAAKLRVDMTRRTLTLAYDEDPAAPDRPWLITWSLSIPGKTPPYITRSRHRDLDQARDTFRLKEKSL